jgi:UDP-N-acetylmuramate dehydrogenase
MNLDLRAYSTFNIGGIAHKVFEIKDISDIEKINSYCTYVNKPLVIIGEGSNSIFADTTDKYVIGLIKITGIEILSQINEDVLIKSYAGEKWDDVVAWSVEHGLSGIESLSGIPGTAGASPIQNIGAYGSELSKVFVEAEVFDRSTKSFITLVRDHCDFNYRDSIFKKDKDRYIIISITLKLSTTPALIPQYKDVQEYFSTNQNPTTKEIRDAIIKIRNNKIPNYKEFPNCGSFFKNPIITKEHLEIIRRTFPTIPCFELPNEMCKVFAGWLIEHVDYKSTQTGAIVFNEANKLVLINTNGSSFEDLKATLSNITKLVQETYNIVLEAEPNMFE